MALNTCELWFNGIKIAFFSKKLQKIAKWLGTLPADPQSLRQLGASPPASPSVIRLSYASFLTTFPKMDTSTFLLLAELETSRTSLATMTSSRTHFEVLGLGLEASSPWPWSWLRSLRSSKIALSSARGQHYFLNSWNFVWKRQKPRGKLANTFFVFRNWSIGVAKLASPPIEISPMTKMWQKNLLFLQFEFFF